MDGGDYAPGVAVTAAGDQGKNRPWLPADDDQLRYLVSCGWSVRRIAGVLNRSITSIYHRTRKWGGLDAMRHATFAVRSAREVAHLFGVPERLVAIWIKERWLRGHRNYGKRSRRAKRLRFLVSDEALEDFLAYRPAWMLWSPNAITDADWRRHAWDARAQHPGRWVTTFELAAMCGWPPRSVQAVVAGWATTGTREVVRVTGRWYIWVSEAARHAA